MTEILWSGHPKKVHERILQRLREKDATATMDDAKDSYVQYCLTKTTSTKSSTNTITDSKNATKKKYKER